MQRAILVIDKDEAVCREIEKLFHEKTVEVQCSLNIAEGLNRFFVGQYCLVIVDVTLLEGCGFSLLGIMRKAKSVPILAVASDDGACDKVGALNSGADGFLMKPYKKEECHAVTDALIRRYIEVNISGTDNLPIEFGKKVLIEPQYRIVVVNGRHLNLTRKEYDILYFLAKRPYQVFTRAQIYDFLWNMDSYFNIDDAVRFHIQNLRRKMKTTLGGNDGCIETVWGVGYRFNPSAIQE